MFVYEGICHHNIEISGLYTICSSAVQKALVLCDDHLFKMFVDIEGFGPQRGYLEIKASGVF